MLRLMLFHEFKKGFRWKTFDIKLGLRIFIIDQGTNIAKVREPDMSLIRARMHGQSRSAGCEGCAPKPGDTWPREITPVAQHGDGVEIDGQFCRHRASSPQIRIWLYIACS
ncbi:hypothetical protein D3C81_1852150 [compost metagenome]